MVDLNKGERIHTISDLGAPQGVAFVPELNRLLVANDKGGVCDIYDANSFQLIGKVDFADDADNVRYDSASKRICVGFGSGGIGIINAVDGKQVGSIKLAAHPEGAGRRPFSRVRIGQYGRSLRPLPGLLLAPRNSTSAPRAGH